MKKKLFSIFLALLLIAFLFYHHSSTEVFKIVDPNQPFVALTFDDGPSKYTKDIIEYLHQEDVVATFFVVGNKVPLYQKTLKKAIRYGNEIENHSYSHKWLTKLDNQAMKEEIEKCNKVIQKELNYKTKFLRPTYGGINDKLRQNTNLKIIFWTVDTRDWKYKNIDSIVSQVKNVKDNDIILMHDLHERTLLALKEIVPLLKEYNFEFVTINQLEQRKVLNQEND